MTRDPNKAVIMITGVSGFLGSHLANFFIEKEYKIIALVRSDSDLWRIDKNSDENFVTINLNDLNAEKAIIAQSPSIFIHSGWSGVRASDRDNWTEQSKNIPYTISLLEKAKKAGVSKVIAFGSQAEYGSFDGKISEDAICKPYSAYGACKLATLDVLRTFCEQSQMNWYWFRLFPMIGTKEGKDWLIPSVILTLLSEKDMNLTKGEQRYGYLTIPDFNRAILKVIRTENHSGVYNLCADNSITLRSLIEKVHTKINTKAKLNFGALPYRPNQVMHMEGNPSKFFQNFNFKLETDFDQYLNEVVQYYISNRGLFN